MNRYFFWLLIFLCMGELRAQTLLPVVHPEFMLEDTVYREQPAKIFRLGEGENDNILTIDALIPHDLQSSIFLPDSIIHDTLVYEFSRIKRFAYRKKLTRELYRMFFINPSSGDIDVIETQNSENRFIAFKGKKIRNISVTILPPFGVTIADTSYKQSDIIWWKEVVNKTHMGTSEKVILRQMTIKVGDRVLPVEMVQNEILLRDLDYIEDAVLRVVSVPESDDLVDLEVFCKDELSWGGSLETNFLNSVEVGLDNKNFMKLGHSVDYEYSYRGTKDKKHGNRLEYKVNGLWNTHIDLRGYYRNDYREKQVRVELERQFLTNKMKWAGGVSVGRVYYSEDLPDRNVSRLERLFNYHFQDVWLGYSFRMRKLHGYNQNLYLTTRFFTTIFNNRPKVDNDMNHLYHNRKNMFSSVVYTKMKYYKGNLLYDFGRTEDIPTGLLLGTTAGYEWSEYENYGYIAAEAHYSHFNQQTERYFYTKAALSSYINEGRFERGVCDFLGSHVSNLCHLRTWRFRFYNSIRYIQGFKRYPADFLYMEDHDLRGFNSDTLKGNKKLSFSLATTFFMPFIKKGFRTSLSTFVDGCLLADRKEKLFSKKFYWGIGFGLNLRNNNLMLKNISFRFTFYPIVPVDGRRFDVMMSGKSRNRFYDYRVSKPQVIQYE